MNARALIIATPLAFALWLLIGAGIVQVFDAVSTLAWQAEHMEVGR